MAQMVKNLPANAGDIGSIHGLGRKFPWRRDRLPIPVFLGLPSGSDGKESTCNAGNLGSIPGLQRSSGRGLGNPLQYPLASLVAQLVKNAPVMQETLVPSLVWEGPPGEGKSYPLQYSGLENSMKSQRV